MAQRGLYGSLLPALICVARFALLDPIVFGFSLRFQKDILHRARASEQCGARGFSENLVLKGHWSGWTDLTSTAAQHSATGPVFPPPSAVETVGSGRQGCGDTRGAGVGAFGVL